MRRATLQQRSERLRAAYELCRGHSSADAARLLAARFALSAVQARRYVRAALAMTAPPGQADTKLPITVRIPRHLVEQLRTRARRTGSSLSALVAQAIANFLSGGTT